MKTKKTIFSILGNTIPCNNSPISRKHMTTGEFKSEIQKKSPMTHVFRVILHSFHGEWVTHCENLTDDEHPKQDWYWGHYFGQNYDAALKDYKERCLHYGLKTNI